MELLTEKLLTKICLFAIKLLASISQLRFMPTRAAKNFWKFYVSVYVYTYSDKLDFINQMLNIYNMIADVKFYNTHTLHNIAKNKHKEGKKQMAVVINFVYLLRKDIGKW